MFLPCPDLFQRSIEYSHLEPSYHNHSHTVLSEKIIKTTDIPYHSLLKGAATLRYIGLKLLFEKNEMANDFQI